MKPINHKLIIITLLFFANNIYATLPEKAYGKPKIFLNTELSHKWETIAKQQNWGESSKQFWKVYIDRDEVKSYESVNKSKVKKDNLNFMDEFFVADLKNGFALLYTEKNQQTDLNISSSAKEIGWVSVDELLLWCDALRERNLVIRKAVILTNLDEIQNKNDLDKISPKFSSSPDTLKGGLRRATELEFYFVYKTVKNSPLLFKESNIDKINNSQFRNEKKGWMKSGKWTSWNDRLCYEPNFNTDNGHDIGVFTIQEDAREYKNEGIFYNINDTNIIYKQSLPKERLSPRYTRFPVLETYSDFTSKVGTVSNFGTSNNKNYNPEKVKDTNEKIDFITKQLRTINVIFVIDGTNSMKNYYKNMAKAINSSMSNTKMQNAKINFGAVVYRDYADIVNNELIEKKALTSDYNSVANWITSRECKSIGKSDYEAVYHGLNVAISEMGLKKEESNFIILIGDAGNIEPDTKGYNITDISKQMAEKDINFIAFQVNHPNHIAYHDFGSQIQKIMTKEINVKYNRKVTRNDYKFDGSIYNYNSDESSIKILSTAYQYANVNQSLSADQLTNLIEDRIISFKEQAERTIENLNKAIDGLSGESDAAGEFESKFIEKTLLNIGLSKEDIEAKKNEKFVFKINGFTTRTADSEEVLIPAVFLTKEELTELIQSLKQVSNAGTNSREILQKAITNLALSYIGGNNTDSYTIDQVMEAVSGLTKGIGTHPLNNFNIKDITQPNRISDDQIVDFIDIIKKDVEKLEKLSKDKSCYFETINGLRYYYILLEDMPLQN